MMKANPLAILENKIMKKDNTELATGLVHWSILMENTTRKNLEELARM